MTGKNPWDDDVEDSPWRKFDNLINESRVGEIDGVKFDLRHESLVTDLWHAPNAGFDGEISYPWMREGRYDRTSEDELRARSLFVERGDAVSIRHVHVFNRGEGPFVDEHDRVERWVFLNVGRPDGTSFKVAEPIIFVPRDAMGPHSPHEDRGYDDGYEAFIADHRITFEKIGLRIERLVAPGRALEKRFYAVRDGSVFSVTEGEASRLPEGTEVEVTWVQSGGLTGPAGEWIRFAERMHELALGEMAYETASPIELTYLVDVAAAAGYALARAEWEARLVPLAKVGLKARESQKKATKVASERADIVRVAATEDIRVNPKTSQGACARRVAAKLGRGEREVARLIEGMFEWRELPGGGREKRPKADHAKGVAGE